MSDAHSRVLEHRKVVEVARRRFIQDGRIEMQELADELAVSRATLYRIASSRERLIGDVLWSLAEAAVDTAREETDGPMDVERLLRIGSTFRAATLRSEALKWFVESETSTAAVALFTPSAMRDRVARAWESLVSQAIQESGVSLRIQPSQAAEVIVTLGASQLLADLVRTPREDIDLVADVLRSLFVQATQPTSS